MAVGYFKPVNRIEILKKGKNITVTSRNPCC